jgi:lipopolysaccharide transport system permease protein
MAMTAVNAIRRAPVGGLIWTLIRTDFKSRYHGTMAGFAWALLKPLTMVAVLLGVFSFIFKADRDYGLNLVLGLFLFEFFSEATRVGLQSLRAKGYLLTKTRAPLWIIVATSASNAVITLAVFVLAILGILVAGGRAPGLGGLALFGVYLLHYLAMVIGISLAASVLFLRYRDLNQVWEVVTQAGFFVAPIIYPLDILPHWIHFYLYLWPPTPIIQFSREVLVLGQVPTLKAHLMLGLDAALILLAGVLVFRRCSPRAAEYL